MLRAKKHGLKNCFRGEADSYLDRPATTQLLLTPWERSNLK
jgi:hypothetical protein